MIERENAQAVFFDEAFAEEMTCPGHEFAVGAEANGIEMAEGLVQVFAFEEATGPGALEDPVVG